MCFSCRRVAVVLLYLECITVLAETILFGHELSQSSFVITCRFLATGILLGVTSVQTIVSVTLCTALAQASKFYTTSYNDDQNHLLPAECALSILLVFAGVTAHWMSLRHITQLQADAKKIANERDAIVRQNSPPEVQVAIIAVDELECLQQTPALVEKLYPDAHDRAGLKWLDARLIGNEKFRDMKVVECPSSFE